MDDEVYQDLIYIPGKEEQEKITANGGQLTKEEALEIMNFVYRHIYLENYDGTADEESYRTYIECLLEDVSQNLPDPVPLKIVRFRSKLPS